MKRRATMTEAKRVAVTTADAPTMQADQPGAGASHTALVTLAEELGRLLARRELARPDRRRGYSLPELLVGALIFILLWVLIGRFLDWLPH